MPWCLTYSITGSPPSVSVALKIALRSLEHHGFKIKLVALNSKVNFFLKKIVTLDIVSMPLRCFLVIPPQAFLRRSIPCSYKY